MMNRNISILILMLVLVNVKLTLAQKISLTGSDICGDGSQSVAIGLTDSDPDKLYALYRDGQMIQVKGINTGMKPNPINFGEMSKTGTYTVSEFSRSTSDFSNASSGHSIRGSVSIFPIPVVNVPKKIDIKSGASVNFQPKSDVEGCTFNWTARLDKGKATGFKKSGDGPITDKIELQGNEPACVIYTITPVNSPKKGACIGNAVELIVWVNP